ncbi:MAG: cytochrome P450 [Rubrivivax sp.]|nr:cytochrome P450 [Rubrivivax sp.]
MNTIALTAAAPRRFADLPSPRALPVLGNAHQIQPARMHLQLEQWARELGTPYRMRIGPLQVMVVDDPEVAQTVLRDRPSGLTRASMFRPIFAELGIDGLFSTEGDDWLPQRKLIMGSLAASNFRGFFPTIRAITERLHRRWQRAATAGEVLEMTQELIRFTVDVTSALSFGDDPNTLEQSGHVIQDHLAAIFPAIMKRTLAPVPHWRWFKLPADRRLDRHLAAVHAYAHECIAKARARLAAHPGAEPANALEAMLLQADQPGSGFTDEVVVANVLTLLLGGEDTTAHSLAWTMMYLAADPALQQHMHHAAMEALGSESVCTAHEGVRELEVFEHLATEATRLRPVAPFLGLAATRDMVIGEVEVPRGTQVMTLFRPAQISPRHFSAPLRYDPMRWQRGRGHSGDGDAAVHDPRAYLQFGAGARVCPGRHLAGVEMRLVLSMLLKHFEVELACDPGEIDEVQNFTVTPSKMPVRLRLRQPAAQGGVRAAPAGAARCPFGHG